MMSRLRCWYLLQGQSKGSSCCSLMQMSLSSVLRPPPVLKELQAAAVHLIAHLHHCAGSQLHNDL